MVRQLILGFAAALLCTSSAFAEDYYDLPDDADVQAPAVPDAPEAPRSSKSHGSSSGAAILDLGADDSAEADQSDGSDHDSPEDEQKAQLLYANRQYEVNPISTQDLKMTPPQLPDLSRYTAAKALEKMPRGPKGRISVESMMDKMSFKGFMGKREGLREWAYRQTSLPKIIYLKDGVVTPADLAAQLPAAYFEQTSKGVYVARLPIDVTPNATFDLGPEVKELRLSQDRGAFLVNEGKMFFHGTKVRGWNEARKAGAWFKDPKDFRPFIVSWAGSQLYILNSVVAHMGYTASKAYGISISQFSPGLQPIMKRPAPTGWVLDSDFYDNWYGFYCYEAEDIVVARNTYHHNIHYGIDPHDYSKRLIIANNDVSKTREKHGIIISREVNDSWIIGNSSYDNMLSGIVLDRNSTNTVIANNKVFRNGADGITIYESPKNLLWQNVATSNHRHGMRVRNSTDLRLYDNVAIANGLAGIYGHIKDVGAGRNVHLDPYHERVSMAVVGGQLISNGSSPISVDAPLSLELYNVDLRAPARQLGIKFTGILGRYQEQVLDILMRKKSAVVIRPVEGTAVSQAGSSEMVFSSNVFLFLFLPLFLAVYYLTPDKHRLRNWVVLIGSYLFYAWWRIDFLVLFAAVTVWNYFVGMFIDQAKAGGDMPKAKRWLIAGVAADLATLAYFKYANFGVASFNALMTSAGFEPFSFAHVILPIGISFYVFESISYIADVYRGDAQATRHPVDFATFVALFPHLIAGPVFRYKDLQDQFESRSHSFEKFGQGALRFMQGFIKKVFIADSVSPMVATAFSLNDPSTADAWLGAAAYTVQLYFDFSGYSDMAIGLGLMMGFRFVENFNQPYISQSITEFWRRWHMSLSSWLRDYLYISLGGNRGGTAMTYRNLFLTMVLGGLWHGANWTFVLWGAWHGGILCVERMLGVKVEPSATKAGAMPGRFLWHRWALTFLFVILGWVMFRAQSVSDAFTMYAAMFRFDGIGLSDVFAGTVTSLQLWTLALAGVLLIITGARSRRPAVRPPVRAQAWWPAHAAQVLIWPVFLLSVLKLSAQSYSPFLYFQF